MNGMSRLKPDDLQTQQSPRHVYVLSYMRPLADRNLGSTLSPEASPTIRACQNLLVSEIEDPWRWIGRL
jgi:hypothetical protein